MKVKPKLIMCFMITVIITSLSGIVGVIFLLSTDSKYSNALIENGFCQGDIGTFNTYLNKDSAIVRDIIFLEDTASSEQELKEIQDKTEKALEKLRLNCATKEEKQYIAIIDEKLPLYRNSEEKVVELGSQNKDEEALQLFHSETRPILSELMTAAEQLADLNVTMGEQVSKKLSHQSMIMLVIIVVFIIITILFSILLAVYIAGLFSNPIIQVQKASEKLALGNLDIQLEINSADEIGQMAQAFLEASEMIKLYIMEISREMQEVSGGNFNISSDINFKGDFIAIEEAINKIIHSLSNTMEQINEASNQVAIGAEQMSENAQNLAEGATEQAASVEELTATIEDVAQGVETSANNTNSSYEQAKKFELEAEQSNLKMEQLMEAMQRISNTSKQIENIISEIEDIATQTNLLSLNASIEAARAGEAGKGFAVVADQIGKLATDSAQSAIHTRELIGNTLKEIGSGNTITLETSESINVVINGIKLIAQSTKEVSEVSKEQADTMRQIKQGIEQISNVIQKNSASAQESSATSEELFAQSENLKALIEQFQLKEG